MSEKHPLKYREVHHILTRFGFTENLSRGKGGHRIFSHPMFRGRPRFYPVPFHGRNRDLAVREVDAIKRAFDLSDEEIYKS